MRVAATSAASVLSQRFQRELARGAVVFTGAGNNGGDGWCIAAALARTGCAVAVIEVAEAAAADAVAERAAALPLISRYVAAPGVVIDAVLGTGAAGRPRSPVVEALGRMRAMRASGARLVAVDVPSGLDATTGECDDCAAADLTVTFGTVKRGLLVSREACGEIVAVDIGLGSESVTLPLLVDAAFVKSRIPHIAADANKGTRKKLAVVAGGEGMGGAAIVAAEGALRAGIGLVKVITAQANIATAHSRIPEALTGRLNAATAAIQDWADVVLIGPGLGRGSDVERLVREVLHEWRGPVVVDADGLNAFDGDLDALARLLSGREAIVTPHPGELARLAGTEIDDILARRFDIGATIAARIGATVLLKGTPTVVSSHENRYVSATGTPVLATGGSGDALGGIIATLLAQGCAPHDAAACGAWVHGRAAELVGSVRGHTLEDVLAELPRAWEIDDSMRPRYPELATLPSSRMTLYEHEIAFGPGEEFRRVRRMIRRLGSLAAGIGDDAALIHVPRDNMLALSTDTSVEGVHFRREWLSVDEIGYRAATAALSDIAAMGAAGVGMLIAMTVSRDLPDEPDQLMEGIARAARAASVRVFGGDTTRASELSLTFTVFGTTREPLTRDAARNGHRVYVTGELGGPAAAVRDLLAGKQPREEWRERFAAPHARIREARWLAGRGARGAIDISDGLVADARHVAAASNVTIELDIGLLPCVPGVAPNDAAVGGEEYELLVTSAIPIDTAAFTARFGIQLTQIGVVRDGEPGVRTLLDGALVDLGRGGFDHFDT